MVKPSKRVFELAILCRTAPLGTPNLWINRRSMASSESRVLMGNVPNHLCNLLAGWWLTYPSEKH